jgi:hypothetical protein
MFCLQQSHDASSQRIVISMFCIVSFTFFLQVSCFQITQLVKISKTHQNMLYWHFLHHIGAMSLSINTETWLYCENCLWAEVLKNIFYLLVLLLFIESQLGYLSLVPQYLDQDQTKAIWKICPPQPP